jgi:hypothetical protein
LVQKKKLEITFILYMDEEEVLDEEKAFKGDADLDDELMEPLDDLDFAGLSDDDNEDDQFDRDH